MIPSVVGAVLTSEWLVPLLALAVLLDGPFPFVPSEPILFGAAATAAAGGDVPRIAVLFAAAVIGSLAGDALLYGAARSSRRFHRPSRRDDGVGAWVRRHLHRRPVVVLVAVRLVPAGRLTSVSAAGRVDLPVRAFVPATLTSSTVWSGYMIGVGVVIGPLTGGDPVRSLVAGLASAVLIGTTTMVVRRGVRRRRAAVSRRRTNSPAAQPERGACPR